MTSIAPVPIGLTVLELARAGRFADISALFAPQLRALVPADALQAAWRTELDRHGPVISVGTPVSEPVVAGMTVVRVPVTCAEGALTVVVTVDAEGLLTGLQLAPASAARTAEPWEPPAYADPDTFDEQDVRLGSGPLAVPGTLTLPHRPGPLPAVVLLAGSGPMDRDETLWQNKPFKDLAWGLASRGVAVLRFDKVTYAHRGEFANGGDHTLTAEYVPDAKAAIHLLQQQPAVDATRVFVLGHSLGGTVAPRVAAAEPSVAGLVVLAGGAQPLHRALVRQFRYLAAQDPTTAATLHTVIATTTRHAETIDSPDFSLATPAEDLPAGAPASYWLDLRDYDPTAAAAALDTPILLLQGGRDYQATVADDLARWQAALADRPQVTVIVREADDHFFFAGTGPSTPADYERTRHMDPAVVADIAEWLATTPH